MNELTEQPPEKILNPNRIRGLVELEIAGDAINVEMRIAGVSVVNKTKGCTDTKSIQDVIDFVIGQGQLPLTMAAIENAAEVLSQNPYQDLLESCIEFIALQIAESNEPGKYQGRYRLAASALREQVETLAPGMIEKVRGEL